MVKTCKSVIAWKIHGSIPFRLVCILPSQSNILFIYFIVHGFASVAYEIIDFWIDVPRLQHLVS